VKVILDTIVLVSGLMFPESVPGAAVAAWREGRFELVMPLAQLGEIGRVLAYPKIRKRLRWDDEAIGRFLKVTGDDDLLVLRGRYAIETPAQFKSRL